MQKVRAGRGATRSRTEDRATLESDPSADPEAGMGGERQHSPPPATRPSPKKPNPSSRHQSAKLPGLGQSPRTCASVRRSATAHHPGWLGYTVHLHNQVSYPTQSRPWRGLTPQPRREPEKLTGKYREKIGGKDPGALQYQSRQDAERRLPLLSAYLGHVHVSDTFWYLSAQPELMREAMSRLERCWEGQS